MTFDDGIIRLYQIINSAGRADMPGKRLRLAESYFFGYETLGINRYYTALKANQHIEAVVHIQGWLEINVAEYVAVLENNVQYRITLSQPTLDEYGLRVTRLSLERINQLYEYLNA